MSATARRLLCLALPAIAALLAGCATLSEDECRQGNWERIGYRDGQGGQPPERIEAHRKACAVYRLSPDELAWQRGRERGLNFYCTPSNGLAVGRRGERYAGVCPEWAERGFLRSFEAGRDIYLARERLDGIEQEERSLELRRNSARNEDELRYYNSQLMRLRTERDFAWNDLRHYELRAERLRF